MASTPVSTRAGGQVLSRKRIDPVLFFIDVVALLAISVAINVDDGAWALTVGAVNAVVTVGVLEMAGFYRPRLTLSALDDLPRLAGWSIITSGVLFAISRQWVSHGKVAVYAAFVFAALLAVRVFYYAYVRRRRRASQANRLRAGLVGGGIVAVEIIESTRERPELGLDIAMAVSDDPMPELSGTGVPIETGVTAIKDLVVRNDLDAVVVAFSSFPDSRLVAPLRECDELDCEIFIVPRLFEMTTLTADMDRIHTIPLIRMRRDALRTWVWKVKRIFDFVVVVTGLVILSPLFAAVALAVYLTDTDAPIIFRQKRIGRGGRLFDVLKFRSMRPVDESASDREWQPSEEERIGRVGRFIRKTSLDELPQLWNVLRGDMSLVGPRPERPHFVEQFENSIPSYRDRHRVDVGLTGWAAIHGLRGDTSIEDRAIYDNFYIENWSVWLDIKILIRTVGSVLRGSGG